MRDAEYVVHPWEVGGQPRSQRKLLQTHLELNVPRKEECRHVSEESETQLNARKQTPLIRIVSTAPTKYKPRTIPKSSLHRTCRLHEGTGSSKTWVAAGCKNTRKAEQRQPALNRSRRRTPATATILLARNNRKKAEAGPHSHRRPNMNKRSGETLATVVGHTEMSSQW